MLFIALAGEALIGAGVHNEYASNAPLGAVFEGICPEMPVYIGLQASATLKICRT